MILPGTITGFDPEQGRMTFSAPFNHVGDYIRKGYTQCEIRLIDGRQITPQQRRKIFALVSDIADWVTDTRGAKGRREEQEVLRQLQLLYLIDSTDKEAARRQLTDHFCALLDIDLFSLSNVDRTTAREFIDWLVSLCVEHDIPCNDTLLARCEDIQRYLYACVAKRRCAICGKKADIHEVERVGMGRDRRKMHHLGQAVQPLCRLHHREVDQLGQRAFDEKYHLGTIRLDEYLCKCIGWKK